MPKGLRYWLMAVDNKQSAKPNGTPNIVGFAIHDRNGNRVAYGTGPLRQGTGDITVQPK